MNKEDEIDYLKSLIKPERPRPPVPPKAPEEKILSRNKFFDRSVDRGKLIDIIPPEIKLEDVHFEVYEGYQDEWDSECAGLILYTEELIDNPDYKKEKKKYDKNLIKYEKEKENYEKRLEEYRKLIKTYNSELKKLNRQTENFNRQK